MRSVGTNHLLYTLIILSYPLESETLRRFDSRSVSVLIELSSGAASARSRLGSDCESEFPFGPPSPWEGDKAAGFNFFFLTTTPFNDFLRSFLTVFGAIGLASVCVDCSGGAFVAVPTVGLLAAVSRAATALRVVSIATAAMTAYTLSEAFELFPIHLLAEAFFFTLLLKHGVKEEYFILFQCAELVTYMRVSGTCDLWQR